MPDKNEPNPPKLTPAQEAANFKNEVAQDLAKRLADKNGNITPEAVQAYLDNENKAKEQLTKLGINFEAADQVGFTARNSTVSVTTNGQTKVKEVANGKQVHDTIAAYIGHATQFGGAAIDQNDVSKMYLRDKMLDNLLKEHDFKASGAIPVADFSRELAGTLSKPVVSGAMGSAMAQVQVDKANAPGGKH